MNIYEDCTVPRPLRVRVHELGPDAISGYKQGLVASLDYRGILPKVSCAEVLVKPLHKRTDRALPCDAFKVTKRLSQFVQFHVVHKTLIGIGGSYILIPPLSLDFCA